MALQFTEYTTDSTGGTLQIKKCAWSPSLGMFCAVGTRGAGNVASVFTSTDGHTWTLRSVAEANQWVSVAWSPALAMFAAVSTGGTHRVNTSSDGINWSNQTAAAANAWQDICWDTTLALFVAVSNGGTNRVMTSANGTLWSSASAATAENWSSIATNGSGHLIAAAASASTTSIMTSSNGTAWSSSTIISTGWRARSLAYASDLSLFLGWGTRSTQHILRSADNGATWSDWTSQPIGWNNSDGNQLAWGHELGLAIGTAGSSTSKILTSTDGISWTLVDTDPTFSFAHDGSDAIGYSPSLKAFALFDPASHDDVILGISTVDSISPTTGNVKGGDSITLTSAGVNGGFTAGTRVFFYNPSLMGPFTPSIDYFASPGLPNAVECTNVVIANTSSLTCKTPIDYFPVNTVGVVAINNNNPSIPNITCYLPNGFVYQNPAIASLTPTSGVVSGGDAVTITGTNLFGFDDPFDDRTIVTFGGVAASSVVVVNSTTITCLTPPIEDSANPVDVTLSANHFNGIVGVGGIGENTYPDSTLAAAFTYNLTSGLDTVTVGPPASGPTFLYAVVNPPPAVVNAVSPAIGLTTGGTTITVLGTGFQVGAVVVFDGVPATGIVVSNSQVITCTTPAHTKGTVEVEVNNP